MSNVHIVKKGDTLWGISNKYNISLNELVEINGLYGKKKNLLKIGQKIYLKKIILTLFQKLTPLIQN